MSRVAGTRRLGKPCGGSIHEHADATHASKQRPAHSHHPALGATKALTRLSDQEAGEAMSFNTALMHLGFFGLIAFAVWVTQSAWPLWALFLVPSVREKIADWSEGAA